MEDEKRALISFVTDIDNHISAGPSRLSKLTAPSRTQNIILGSKSNLPLSSAAARSKRSLSLGGALDDPTNSPVKTELTKIRAQPSLLEQMPEVWEGDEISFHTTGGKDLLGDKENMSISI